MDTVVHHQIQYDVLKPILIDDVIASLKANERLIKTAAAAIEKILPGITIDVKTVHVSEISQRSPFKEILAAAIIIAYQKELSEEVPDNIERILRIDIPENLDATITVLVMIFAVYGISKAFELAFPSRPKDPLADSQTDLLGKAAALTGVPSEEVRRAVEDQFSNSTKRQVVKSAQGFFSPARGQPETTIRGPIPNAAIHPEAVKLAQAAAGFPIDEDDDDKQKETSGFHQDVEVVLHAMDKDSRRSGWAGHVPSIFDERVPMKVDKSIKQESLFGRASINGDILLISEQDEFGELKPKEFLLLRANL